MKVKTATDDEAHASHLRGLVSPHDPGERVAVNDTQRGNAEHGGLREQLFGARCPAQEAEVRCDLKLGVGHPNSP